MSFVRRAVVAGLGIALVAAAAATAQQRAFVVGAYGGGYAHFANLSQSADFKPGYNLGGTVGIQLNNLVSLHGDVTFARSRARGLMPFAGADVDRLFYGAHMELAYEMLAGLKGYAFAGGGMVRIDQAAPERFTPFSKPAGMLGLGMFINVPRTELDIMVEGKTLVYKFDRAGFDTNLWDLTYGIGLAYRIPLR